MFAVVPTISNDPLALVLILFGAAVVLGFVLYMSFGEKEVVIIRGRRKGFRRQKSGMAPAPTLRTNKNVYSRAKFSSSTFLPRAPEPIKPKSEFNVWMKSDPAGKAVTREVKSQENGAA
jgi:hypothetical protein